MLSAVLWCSISVPAADYPIYTGANEHKYQWIMEEKTWEEAESFCKAQNGYLVTVTSREEFEFILKNILAESKKSTWAGGTDRETEGTWKWITGEKWDFTWWNKGEPDRKSVV